MLVARLALIAALAIGSSLSGRAADFYAGKIVEIVIPGPAGGGPSEQARIFSDFMTKHTVGAPKFVIRAMPGGGGVQALNYLAEIAKPDGLTLLWGPIQFTGALVGGPGYRFDPASFEPIGTSSLMYVVLANAATGTGVKTPNDFLNVGEFNFGGLGRGRSIDFFARLSFDLLGLKHKYVLGYQGQPEVALALQRKEIDASITGHTGYVTFYEQQMVSTGIATPLYYHSSIDPTSGEPKRVADGIYPKGVMHFLDFMKSRGKDVVGPEGEAYRWTSTYETWPAWFVAPKGAPTDALAALRYGFDKAVRDPEFGTMWKSRFNEDLSFINFEQARKIQSGYRNISPAALEILKQM